MKQNPKPFTLIELLVVIAAPSSDFFELNQVLVNGLTPGTNDCFAVESTAETANLTSAPGTFTTTKYVPTNAVFDLTYAWKHTTSNLHRVGWTDPGYGDSGWSGSGGGLLWIDVRQNHGRRRIPLELWGK